MPRYSTWDPGRWEGQQGELWNGKQVALAQQRGRMHLARATLFENHFQLPFPEAGTV